MSITTTSVPRKVKNLFGNKKRIRRKTNRVRIIETGSFVPKQLNRLK